MDWLAGLENAFSGLLNASWQASELALLVLALQWALGGRLNPRWRYALWLLVLGRLLLPVQPESALSLFRFTPAPPSGFIAPITEPLFAPPPLTTHSSVDPLVTTEPGVSFSFYSVLALVWLAGATILFVLTWQVNRRFARQMSRSLEVRDPVLLALFAAAKDELTIRRSIRLVESGQVQSPAIMGLFHPTLLLPAQVRAKFDETELRLIFLHELAHLKRGDVIAQGLIALLQILHWFNPVLWFAFRRMRVDREPATDALVLSRAGEAEKERYGLMLIKLLEHFNQRHALPTLVGILEEKDQFKRRFTLIARFTRGAYGWSLLGLILIGILSVACLTKSKANDPAVVVESTNESGDKTARLIRVAVKVVQIEEGDYQAHRGEIDGAMQKGDITPLADLRSFELLAESLSLSKSGERSVMESVRVLPYPIAYQKDKNGKMNPTQFKKRNVGFRLPFSAVLSDGKINLTGDLEITTFRGWIPAADSTYEPIFNARRLPFDMLALDAGRTIGLMETNPSADSADPEAYFGPNDWADQPKRSAKLCRLFLFVNVQVKPAAETKTSFSPSQPVNASSPDAWTASTRSPTTIAVNAPVGSDPGLPQNVGGQPPVPDPANPAQIRVSVIITGKNLKDWPHLKFSGSQMDVPPISRIDLGTTTIPGGGTGSVASVYKFPYPTDFDPAERVQQNGSANNKMTLVIPVTPREFVTTPVGWSMTLQPSVEKGQIHLQGTAAYTDVEWIPRGVYGEQSGPIYGDVKDPQTGKTSYVLLSANPGSMPAFKKSDTPFFVFCQPGRDYTVRLPYGSDWVNATIRCDLISVADAVKPAGDTAAGMSAPNAIQNANALMNYDSIVAPPVKGPGVEIVGKLKEPGQVDFSRSSGLLLSPDGVGYKFGFGADGSFTIPHVQPGVYNRRLRLFPKGGIASSLGSHSPQLEPVTIAAGYPRMTMNISLDNPLQDPLAPGDVEISLKLASVDADDYEAHHEMFDQAVKKGGPDIISLINNRKGADLLSTPSVTTPFKERAQIDIVREFPHPTTFTTDKDGKVTPDAFITTDVGIKASVVATQENGKILLNCALTITDFDGFAEGDTGIKLPTFHTVESRVIEEVKSGELKGVWIPGGYFNSQILNGNGVPVSYVPQVTSKRLLLLLSARDN